MCCLSSQADVEDFRQQHLSVLGIRTLDALLYSTVTTVYLN